MADLTVTSPAPVADFDFPAPGTPGYDEFRKTGKLPSASEDSAPSKEVIEVETETPEVEEPQSLEEEESAPSEVVTRAESAPAPSQGKKKLSGEQRKEQLNSEIRELAKTAAELKKVISEARKPESQPAAELPKPASEGKPVKPKLADLDAQGKPKYATWGDYETALDKYSDERDVWLEKEALRKFTEASTKTQKDQKAAEAEQVIAKAFGEKVAEARKKYADFDAIALDPTIPIKQGSVADQFIVSSKHGADVAYHLGQNREELAEILKMNPIDQARALFEIEQTFKPKPAAPKPPARTITQAPPPPHQVTGKGPTPDPVERAVKDGDFATFANVENTRILALRKAKGR